MNKRTSILVQPQPLGKNTLNEIQIASLDANYDESAAITSISVTSTQIDLKIGDKINIAGQSLEINADASAGDRNLTIVSITLTAPITIGNEIRINEENLFEQYQRKTEGTVAGFDIDADGISKGGVEITGWLDSDTMTGATANNVPTAESVKAYVDASSGGTTPTLQEVTDTGNTTTNSVMIGSSSSPDSKLHIAQTSDSDGLQITGYDNENNSHLNLYVDQFGNDVIVSSEFLGIYSGGSARLRSAGYLRLESINHNNQIQVDNGYIKMTTSGAEAMRITSSGNVGIGTTSPSQLFVINGGSGQLITTDSHQRLFITSSPLHQAILYFGDTNLSSQGRVAYDNNYDDMYFNTAGAEKMRIKSSGNVGIGTTAPGVKLDVDGQIRSDDSFLLQSGTTAIGSIRNQSGALDIRGDSTRDVSLGSVTNPQALFVEGTNGNVGIGTTSPGEKLEVSGKGLFESVDIFKVDASANPRLRIGRYNAETLNFDIDDSIARIYHLQDELSTVVHQLNITVDSESTAGAKINLGFRDMDGTNESTKFTVLDTGNVGIGTTAPTEKLHVVGDTKIDGGLKVTAANIDFTGLGTTDPILQGRLWNDGGTLKISAG